METVVTCCKLLSQSVSRSTEEIDKIKTTARKMASGTTTERKLFNGFGFPVTDRQITSQHGAISSFITEGPLKVECNTAMDSH
jgi:hypothetical protein